MNLLLVLRSWPALLLLLALPAALGAQGRRSSEILYEPEPPLRCEAWNAPSSDTTLSRLDVHLWIQPGLLVFVRENGDTSLTPFGARADVSIEVFDSTHTARARKYLTGRLASATSDAGSAYADPLRLSASFDLPPGSYSVTAEVADAESQRRISRNLPVALRFYGAGAIHASSLLLCDEPSTAGRSGPSIMLDGSVLPLGRAVRGYLSCSGLSAADSVDVTLRLTKPGKSPRDTVTVLARAFRTRGMLGIVPSVDTLIACRYDTAGGQAAGILTISFPIGSDTLPVGSYGAEVVVSHAGRSAAVRQSFSVQWAGMPRTLTSLALAVQALQYVMPKEEYAALRGADSEAQRRMFEAFWSKKNPTPKSAFNPFMAEYYRRADIAAQDFSTIRTPNGINTDRGKVLILYGEPSSKERVLGTSSAPREIWNYKELNRSLIFIDEKRTGDYTLLSEQ